MGTWCFGHTDESLSCEFLITPTTIPSTLSLTIIFQNIYKTACFKTTNKRGNWHCHVVEEVLENCLSFHSYRFPLKSDWACTPTIRDTWYRQVKEEIAYFVLMYQHLIMPWPQILFGAGEDQRRKKVQIDTSEKEELMLRMNFRSHDSWQSHGNREMSFFYLQPSDVPIAYKIKIIWSGV